MYKHYSGAQIRTRPRFGLPWLDHRVARHFVDPHVIDDALFLAVWAVWPEDGVLMHWSFQLVLLAVVFFVVHT